MILESEPLFRQLAEHALVGIYIIQDGKYVYANPKMAEIFGYSEEEVLALDDWLELVAIPDRPLVAEQVRRRLRGETKTARYSFRGLRREGTIIDVEVYGSRTEVNGRRAALGNLIDITERGLAEKALRASEELFRRAFDDTNVAMVLIDLDHRFVRVNSAFAQMFGYSPAEMLGMTVAQITHPDDLAESYSQRKPLLAGVASYFQMEKRYVHRDGHILTALTNVSLVRDAAGRPQMYIGQVQDISERKQAESSLRKSEERTRTILDTANDPFITIDANGRIIDWNRQAEAVFGWTRGEAIGRLLSETIIPVAYRAAHERGIALFRATGEGPILNKRIEITALRRDGHEFPVELLVWPTSVDGFCTVSAFVRDITERKQTEAVLRERENLLRNIIANIPCAVFWKDRNSVYLGCNDQVALNHGLNSPEQIVGRNDYELGVASSEADFYRACDRQVMETTEPILNVEETLTRSDGARSVLLTSKVPLRDAVGTVIGVIGVYQDITDRKRLEDQLRQSQKMEAIGALAGGVAHDFNNLLTVINGYCEIVLADPAVTRSSREMVREIHRAGDRAAALTRQLLAFSRKQVLAPQVLDVNALVREATKMLRRMIGEDIDLTTTLDPGLGRVKADPGQVEQVIMNLVVNARDAMPTGGQLTIETRNVELDAAYVRQHLGVRAGPCILLAVTDTGVGMDAATQAHIFEPFFTTKGPGKGTGLGLSTVFGIVKQSNGHIELYSEPGHGTTFKVYLPLLTEDASTRASPLAILEVPRGTETILLAEDEEAIRDLARIALQSFGYTLLEAANGEEALRIAAAHPTPIDLLVTDVVMPKLSGQELAERLQKVHPGMKVLYISGYTDDAIVRHRIVAEGVAFLHKPFVPSTLARKVREVLDGSGSRYG